VPVRCRAGSYLAINGINSFIQSRVSILPVTFGALLIGAVARDDVERALAGPCKAAAKRRVPRPRAAA